MNDVGLGITLKKLSKQEGQWVLEVERMIPLGAFHQPIPQKIEGQALIGRHLRAVPELAGMAEATETLMLDDGALDCYEIWEGNWVDEEMVRVLAPNSPKAHRTMGAARLSTSGVSGHELSKVQRINEALTKRIALLEATSANSLGAQFDQMSRVLTSFSSRLKTVEGKLGIEASPEVAIPAVGSVEPTAAAPAPVAAAAAVSESAAAAAAVSEPAAAAVSEPAAAAVSEPAAAAEEAAAATEPSAEEAAQEPVKPEKRMQIPKTETMKQSIVTLIGQEIALSERDEKVDLAVGSYHRVTLLDDQDALVGLMIADVEATIRLAAMLLMLPDSERDNQLESGNPTEDSTEMMGEIFNVLSATVNNVKNNPHVRTTPLAALPSGEFEWPDNCDRRVDIDVEGGGIIVVCSI